MVRLQIRISTVRKLPLSTKNFALNSQDWSIDMGVLLFHSNPRPLIARQTITNIAESNMEVFHHPSYSPDISPIDYHLFMRLDVFIITKINEELII